MDKVATRLNSQIEEEFIKLDSLADGSEEQTRVSNNLTQLYKLRLEEMKIASEADARITDIQHKDKQLKEQKTDRIFRTVIETVGVAAPLGFYAFWMRKGFKFEETGTFTSTTFKGLFSRFKPTKK